MCFSAGVHQSQNKRDSLCSCVVLSVIFNNYSITGNYSLIFVIAIR